MPVLTSCIFENRDFTGAANCNSIQYGNGGWAWATWTFSDRRASLARVRTDNEIIIPLVPTLNTAANRQIIDNSLAGRDDVSRTTGIRAGMVPYSAVPYSGANPSRHPSGRVLVDFSFRIRVDLPWYCLNPDVTFTIHYYLHVFLNSTRNIQANVDGWSFTRDDSAGVCNGSVGDEIRPAVVSGVSPLQSALGTQLSAFSRFQFNDIYFLPGTGQNSGREDVPNVRNEAAIILIR